MLYHVFHNDTILIIKLYYLLCQTPYVGQALLNNLRYLFFALSKHLAMFVLHSDFLEIQIVFHKTQFGFRENVFQKKNFSNVFFIVFLTLLKYLKEELLV